MWRGGLTVTVFGLLLLAYAGYTEYDGVMFSLRPSHLIIGGIFGAVLFATMAAGGLIWERLSSPLESDPAVSSLPLMLPQSPSPGPRGPVTLVPNTTPLPPDTKADKVARYLQLKAALPRALGIKATLKESAQQYVDSQKPGGTARPARTEPISLWETAVHDLRMINSELYKDRPLDLDSVPFADSHVEGSA